MTDNLIVKNIRKKMVWFVFIMVMVGLFLPTNMSENTTITKVEPLAAPGAKNMTFYMHNSTSARYVFDYSTTYIANTTLGDNTTALWDQQRVRMNWLIHPVLAGDFEVSGNISTVLYINTKGVSANANLYVDIFDVSYKSAGSETSSKIYSGSKGVTITSGIDSYQIDINSLNHTFSAGHSIRIYCEVQGGASAEFGIWFGNNTYDSRITFEAFDYVDIANIKTRDYQDTEKSNFQLNVVNKTIKIQTNITDPFGGYDIKTVKISLEGPGYNLIHDNITMYKIEGTPISFGNVYEALWNYSTAVTGQYNITIWVVDNNGHYYYFHKEKFTYGNYPDIEASSFFIGGEPRLGLITIYDKGPTPAVLEGAVVKVIKGNNILFVNNTNSQGVAGVYAFQGTYDIQVEWQEVTVGLVTDFLITENFNLTINCSVFYPSFKVVDNSSNPLEGANVYLQHPNGTFLIRPYSTNETGMFDIDKAPLGDYNLIVKWRDVEVADITHLVDKNGMIATIFTQVFKAEIKFVDSRNIELPGAQVTFANAISGLILDSKLSNLQGKILTQLPAGTYNVTVRWQQRVIKQFELKLSGDLVQTVKCWVYYVNFIALDPEPHNKPVENAQIVFTAPESGGLFDSVLTGPEGTVETRLPIGAVDIVIYWKSTIVNTTQVMTSGDVDSDNPIKLKCAIFYLTLKTIDSQDNAVENAQITITFNSNNEVVDTLLTDDVGEAEFRLPKESFDISVRWRDTLVYTETAKNVSQDEYYEINCKIYYLTLKAVDSQNKPIENAQITISLNTNKNVVNTLRTGLNGQVVFRLAEENYDIVVLWRDKDVYLEKNKPVTADEVYELKCKVYYLTLKTIDSQNITVEDAQITISFSSDNEVLDTIVTNETGQAMFRLPSENYDILVRWHDAEVYFETNKKITKDEFYEIDCKIYYLTLKAIDSRDIPVESAQITISFSDNNDVSDTLITPPTGEVIFRLPEKQYDVVVRWQDTVVYTESTKLISADEYYELDCMIYYLELNAIDSRDIPVMNAQITIAFSKNNDVIDTLITNETGYAISRLPKESYDLNVRWYDTEIYYENDKQISNDEIYDLNCWVYYLKVKAVDSKNVSLVDAQVSITMEDQNKITDTDITNVNGSIESRLPIGDYNIEIVWEGVLVKSIEAYQIDSDDSLLLTCNVFYFTINLVDYESVPLDNAKITLLFNSDNRVYDSAITGEDGSMVSRIPIGSYDIEVVWKNVLVYSESAHSLNSDEEQTLTTKVFYLRIKVIDNEKNPLKDVSVTIEDIGKILLENNYTAKNGKVEFRLPYDTYDIKARLQTTHYYADIDQTVKKDVNLQNQSLELTLKFNDFPPPFTDTPVFGIIASIIIFIIIIFLLWFLILKKKFGRKDKTNEEPEDDLEMDIEKDIEKEKEPTTSSTRIRPELVKRPFTTTSEPENLTSTDTNDVKLSDTNSDAKKDDLKVNKDTLSNLLSSSKKD